MMACQHTKVTINEDRTLTCSACNAKMSRVSWNWSINIITGQPAKAKVQPTTQPTPGDSVPPWNNPMLDSVPTDDNASEHEPEVQD